jgi:hypothetical protein
VLPENTLRLYVQFSRPMSPRDVHRRVQLLAEDGRAVPLAFVEVREGLWDPDRTRLTLFLHPGRIKRGVAPGERLGPPLRAGRSYRLVVDAAMADALGTPLGAAAEFTFQAGPADREPPVAEAVRVRPPAGGRDPVVVAWPEPLDHALQHRFVWVETAEGSPVAGEIQVGPNESTWTLVPDPEWTPGGYAVRVRSALEDRAGNRFDRPFDRDPGQFARPGDTVFSFSFEVAGR